MNNLTKAKIKLAICLLFFGVAVWDGVDSRQQNQQGRGLFESYFSTVCFVLTASIWGVGAYGRYSLHKREQEQQ